MLSEWNRERIERELAILRNVDDLGLVLEAEHRNCVPVLLALKEALAEIERLKSGSLPQRKEP